MVFLAIHVLQLIISYPFRQILPVYKPFNKEYSPESKTFTTITKNIFQHQQLNLLKV